MKAVSVLFFIQNFEVKRFSDCAGYREVVKPMLSSGFVKEHHISFFERSHEHIKPLLTERIANYAQQFKGKRVVVYGAGLHTQSLLNAFTELNIVAFADREKTLQGQVKWGCPVIAPEQIPAYADAVLISSRAFESAIIQDLKKQLPESVFILPLYQGLFDKKQWHRDMATSLKQDVSEIEPAILFFLPSHPEENLPACYFHEIKNCYPSLKIVTLWWDYDEQSASSSYLEFEKQSLSYSDLVIENTNDTRLNAMKNREGVYKDHIGAEKVIFHPTSIDPELFFPRHLPKLYDVAIFGSSAGKRKEWIEFLQAELGDRFHHIGGVSHGDEPLPMEDYAKAIAQTKIVVNTQTYPFRLQCKGRVREVLASGSFLLEEANQETKTFLNHKDFLAYFDSPEMLLEKIKYYLRDDNLRESLAKRASQWFSENRSPESWTSTLIAKLFPK